MNYQLIAGQYTENPATLEKLIDAGTFEYGIVQTVNKGITIRSIDALVSSDLTVDAIRLHLFGSSGDLIWRVDDRMCYWRYVGNAGVEFPVSAKEKHYPGKLCIASENVTSLLWGQLDGQNNRWYDDRVGKASVNDRLLYPIPKDKTGNGCRVELFAHNVLNDNDELMAVWTYGIKIHQEESA